MHKAKKEKEKTSQGQIKEDLASPWSFLFQLTNVHKFGSAEGAPASLWVLRQRQCVPTVFGCLKVKQAQTIFGGVY